MGFWDRLFGGDADRRKDGGGMGGAEGAPATQARAEAEAEAQAQAQVGPSAYAAPAQDPPEEAEPAAAHADGQDEGQQRPPRYSTFGGSVENLGKHHRAAPEGGAQPATQSMRRSTRMAHHMDMSVPVEGASLSTVYGAYGTSLLAEYGDADDPSVTGDPTYGYSRSDLDAALRSACKSRRQAMSSALGACVPADAVAALPPRLAAAAPREILAGILADSSVRTLSRRYGVLSYAAAGDAGGDEGAQDAGRAAVTGSAGAYAPMLYLGLLIAYPLARTARKGVADGTIGAFSDPEMRSAAVALLGHCAKRMERAIVALSDKSALDAGCPDGMADAVEAYAAEDGRRAMQESQRFIQAFVG